MQKQVVEIYRNLEAHPIELLESIVGKTSENLDKNQLYAELGFETLSRRNEGPERFYSRPTNEDWLIWKHFLPTIYSFENGDWKNFVFDSVPMDILREIQYAKSISVFDDICIRTPEKLYIDPLVYGLVQTSKTNKDIYIIGRWGESLIPFVDICKQVFSQSIRSLTLIHKEILEKSLFPAWMETKKLFPGWVLCTRIKRFSLQRHCSSMMYRVSIGDEYYSGGNIFNAYLCLKCGEIAGIH